MNTLSKQLMQTASYTMAILVGVLTATCSDKETVASTPAPVVTTPTTTTLVENPATPPMPLAEQPIPGLLHWMAFPSMIDGKQNYTSTLRPDLLPANASAATALGTLARTGQAVRMIALGGSLTAGVRNGGLYRDGQLTAYPNLVARQMGITDFQSPAFGPAEANGTGFMVYSNTAGPYPRWQQVSDQLAAVRQGTPEVPPVLSQFTGSKVDNFAAPGMSGDAFSYLWRPNANIAPFMDGNKWLSFQPFLWRYMSMDQNQTSGLIDHVLKNKAFDLFLLEDRAEDWLRILRLNDNLSTNRFIYELTIGQFEYGKNASKLAAGGKRGVIFTVPDFQDYAFSQWYTASDLKAKASVIDITYRDERYPESMRKLNTNNDYWFMPTPAVAKLFEGLKQGDVVRVTLTDADVMDQYEGRSSNPWMYNEQVTKMAKDMNLALVDLNALYKQIRQGTYTAEGGLRIDGSPKGNFFSSDGTYPTAIGQAVIANEVIKAINSTYQARIPLINVREFAQTVRGN